MANEEHLALLKQGVKAWNEWMDENLGINPDLSRADFSKAKLRRVDLVEANLVGADLSGADLSGADLSGADLSRAKLVEANLIGADFNEAKLIETNLSGADLFGANLFWADLSRANLSEAQLIVTTGLSTNFNGATFTGACLQDWNINSQTNLDNVICDYVYLKENQQERRPASGKFAPREFTKLFEKALETVDLIFRNGIDWQVFLASFNQLQIEADEQALSVQAIEKKKDGAFVIRVDAPPDADKAKIEESFWKKYQPMLEAKDEQIAFYRQEIEYKRRDNTRLIKIIETMAEKPTFDLRGSQFGGGLAGRDYTGDVTHNYEQKGNLAEAAAEIQQLLEQLSQTYPTNTTTEKMALATEAIKRIESNPTLMERILSALKAGGISALEQALNHPAASFFINAFQDWQQTEPSKE